MYCECVSTPEFLAGNRVSLTHAGEGGVVVSALRVRCSRTRLQSGAKCLGSARRSRVTASPGLVEERERGRRTVVDQRPPLLCEPDDGPARPDAGPPRERSKHPPHGRFPQEAERNHPPRDQEGVTVWARGQPSGSCALVRQSEAASDPSRYALSPLVVEPSSRLSEREEEEPGRDRLEVERRIRCQVGREVHAPVDERVGDQDTEQDRPRQLYERSLVSQRVSRSVRPRNEPSCRRRTKSTTLPGAAAGPSGIRFRRRAGALPFAAISVVRSAGCARREPAKTFGKSVRRVGACVRRRRRKIFHLGLGRKSHARSSWHTQTVVKVLYRVGTALCCIFHARHRASAQSLSCLRVSTLTVPSMRTCASSCTTANATGSRRTPLSLEKALLVHLAHLSQTSAGLGDRESRVRLVLNCSLTCEVPPPGIRSAHPPKEGLFFETCSLFGAYVMPPRSIMSRKSIEDKALGAAVSLRMLHTPFSCFLGVAPRLSRQLLASDIAIMQLQESLTL